MIKVYSFKHSRHDHFVLIVAESEQEARGNLRRDGICIGKEENYRLVNVTEPRGIIVAFKSSKNVTLGTYPRYSIVVN